MVEEQTMKEKNTDVPPLFPSQIAFALIEQRSEADQQQRNDRAIRLLTDWTNATGEEAQDQTDTLAYLIEHFNEAHGNREIFPDPLKQQLHQILQHNE